MEPGTTLTLWQYAKAHFPLRCNAYLKWFDASTTTISDNAGRRAEQTAARMPGTRWPHETILAEIEEKTRAAEKYRFLARHILAVDLPSLVRKALVRDLNAGRVEISGRQTAHPTREAVDSRDIAVMEIDLGTSSLIGTGVTWSDVSVTLCSTDDTQKQDSPQPEPKVDTIAPEAEASLTAPGKPSGKTGYAKADAPLVEEMHRAVVAGATVWSAATSVSIRAEGSSRGDSKIKRLAKRYKETYPP